MRGRHLIAATAVCAALATNAVAVEGLTSKPDPGASTFRQGYTETREPCKRYDRLRIPFFGDLHVHTAFSQDASTQGTRTTPREAYRFARGEQIGIQPFDKEGRASRSLKLTRALDFAVVTDHAEQLGETRICRTPGLRGYDSMMCRTYRQWPRAAFFWMNFRTAGMETPERFGFCGDEGRDCLEAARGVWADIIDAAEGAYDRTSSCGFTTFIGYEWTGAPAGNNLHRNVIFRNDQHTELPISFIEAPAPETLWRSLREQCIDLEGTCDALIIPHNSNLSGGLMFESVDSQRRPIDFAYAAERIAREPLVEVMQHKGDSECVASPLTEDERCDFEKLPYSNFRGKYIRGLREPPQPQAFVREALKQGLAAESKLGINPFKVGMVGSTDTHLGAAGAVVEDAYLGHGGAGVPARDEIPSGLPDDLEFNPGGLAGIWAEENSRDALFEAMKRREVWGTSGPRIVVRLFASFAFPTSLCSSAEFARVGYERGVPMGGDLGPNKENPYLAPQLAVWALADVGTGDAPAVPLDRVQIVKGWLDSSGKLHEKTYDVAVGTPSTGEKAAAVDAESCKVTGAGPKSLCALWSDPDFDSGERAFYYARVLEAQTCRWSQRLCVTAGARCDVPETIAPGYEACCDPTHRRLIQERAWTSPIWYSPTGATAAAPDADGSDQGVE